MKKILGIAVVLVVVCVIAAVNNRAFLSAYNIQNVINWTALYGILAVGVAFVIISGGIDLSIGSMVGLIGCLLPWMMVKKEIGTPWAVMIVFGVAAGLGLIHGLLITKLKLQPFVVTLCGLMVYRGVARWITGDTTQGFGDDEGLLRTAAVGKVPVPGVEGVNLPAPFFILVALAVGAAVLLNRTLYGRYLKAVGRNEQAARFSGINTDGVIIRAYVLCAVIAGGVGGVLLARSIGSIQPASHGNAYELYAIAAAVLGGCSLRGGEGSVLGVVLGTALFRVLYNAAGIMGLPDTLEMTIMGTVILVAVVIDEALRRFAAVRVKRAEA
jgi:ribose transport system permease protein